MAFYFVDADTGHELLFFLRRGEVVIMERYPADAEFPRRFIKRLHEVTFTVTLTVDSFPGARSNPLYVDFKLASILTDTFLNRVLEVLVSAQFLISIEDIRNEIHKDVQAVLDAGKDIFVENFGQPIKDFIRIGGVEYKAGSAEEAEGWEYSNFHWLQIWHHYKNDEKELDGHGTV